MTGEAIVLAIRLAESKRRAITGLRKALITFQEDYPMPLHPEVEAAVAELNTALDTETAEISATVQTLIDQINAGTNPADVVAALTALKTRVLGISDALPTPGTRPSARRRPTG